MADSKELGRVRTTDTSYVILSEVHRKGELAGYSINKWIETEKYTGFTKGSFLPLDILVEFLKVFGEDHLEAALSELRESSIE